MTGILGSLLGNLWGLATSSTVSVTVTEPPPPPEELLTISANKTTIQTGEIVTFSGRLTVDGVGVSREIGLFVNGSAVTDTMTDANGYYSISWSTPNVGSYTIRVEG